MSHPQQQQYCRDIKEKFPRSFVNIKVLDVGSLDINGNTKQFFDQCDYTGLDIGAGPNVDVISVCHSYKAESESFDTIISMNCFEHDKYYERSFSNIVRMLKPGGLFVFSCGGKGRAEHGTRRSSPKSSPLTVNIEKWDDYYKNLNQRSIKKAMNVNKIFSEHKFNYNKESCDIRFWGVKS